MYFISNLQKDSQFDCWSWIDHKSVKLIWIRSFLSLFLFPCFLKMFVFHSFLRSSQSSSLTNSQVQWNSINIFLNNYIPLIYIQYMSVFKAHPLQFLHVCVERNVYLHTRSLHILWYLYGFGPAPDRIFHLYGSKFCLLRYKSWKMWPSVRQQAKWAPARGSFLYFLVVRHALSFGCQLSCLAPCYS